MGRVGPWVRRLRGLNLYVSCVGQNIFYVGHNFYVGCVDQIFFCMGCRGQIYFYVGCVGQKYFCMGLCVVKICCVGPKFVRGSTFFLGGIAFIY